MDKAENFDGIDTDQLVVEDEGAAGVPAAGAAATCGSHAESRGYDTEGAIGRDTHGVVDDLQGNVGHELVLADWSSCENMFMVKRYLCLA